MSVSQVFNQYATQYDSARRRLIPCFDAFYQTVVDIVPFEREQEFSVLDLGAGTGLLTEMLAGTFANARFTLLDVAEKMLEQARGRLASYGDRFQFVVKDYADSGAMGDDYDLIVSGLSIHHLDNQAKETLFCLIHKHLRPGALFVNADQVLGETPEIDAMYRQNWLAMVKKLGCSEQEIAAAFERMKEDKMSTLSHQLMALKNAGFSQVNCWFKHFSFVVYSAQKNGSE